MKYCINCGNRIEDNAAVCPACNAQQVTRALQTGMAPQINPSIRQGAAPQMNTGWAQPQQIQQPYGCQPAYEQQSYTGQPAYGQHNYAGQPVYGQQAYPPQQFAPGMQAAAAQPTIVINNTNTNSNTNTNAIINGGIGRRVHKWTAFFLCLFLGTLGVHRFYERKILTGIIWLFTLGLFGFGWFFDLIRILMKPGPYYYV